jgi:class 3 adenylate cyclase
MALSDELRDKVGEILRESWSSRDGEQVPEAEDVQLGNDAVKLEGTVLYADMVESTLLVDSYKPQFAAEIYKVFLHCSAQIIRHNGGVITAYDGDRIMAVFLGKSKNTSAVRAALGINWAKYKVINPGIKSQYPRTSYEMKHVSGVDSSNLLVARTGVRGANDLVWVGRAANHAAKLSSLPATFASRISEDVYKAMHKSVRISSDGREMWESATWEGRTIYRSTWYQRRLAP